MNGIISRRLRSRQDHLALDGSLLSLDMSGYLNVDPSEA